MMAMVQLLVRVISLVLYPPWPVGEHIIYCYNKQLVRYFFVADKHFLEGQEISE